MDYQKEAVRIMQDYIIEHIHEDISIDTIVAVASEKPARKVIVKHGIKATDYWTYCEEVTVR